MKNNFTIIAAYLMRDFYIIRVMIQYLHCYTLRDVQNSLSICFLVIKNSGQTNYFVCPAVFALLQVIIMRLPARINY